MKNAVVLVVAFILAAVLTGVYAADDGTVGPGNTNPGYYLLKLIYNGSDSTASAVLVTKQGDTATLRIPTMSYTIKLPVISKIIGTGNER